MILKIIFICIFSITFIYGVIRPFSSIIAKVFIMLGSLLGILSLAGEEYAQMLAVALGIGRGTDLYLYLGLVTIFLFISFTVNRLDSINKKISKLTKEIALQNVNKEKTNK
jgi:small membrane protein